jgi:hypothetical protein
MFFEPWISTTVLDLAGQNRTPVPSRNAQRFRAFQCGTRSASSQISVMNLGGLTDVVRLAQALQ